MSNKAYYLGDANAIARLMKKMYLGVETEVPVYKELARKVIRAYQPDANGKAQLWFDADAASISVTFSGTHTISDITIDGKAYKLITMTGSGTLTVKGGEVQYWMCGGGCSGEANRKTGSARYNYESGRGGCGGRVASGTMLTGTWQVLIGAGGDTSKNGAEANSGGNTSITFGGTTTTAEGGNIISGGSGGGSAANYSYAVGQRNGGSGDGVSTIPFGLTSLGKACPGGGGGGLYKDNSNRRNGGAGGSNGAGGGDTSTGGSDGGAGGETGGGNGGNSSQTSIGSGKAATFYGGAGGGGAVRISGSFMHTNGGAGYQGVVYVLQEAV